MSLINFIHLALKALCLEFFSFTHSFNYLNYISFIILILRKNQQIGVLNTIYIAIYFIIYDIVKFFTNNLTVKINRFIGDHAYYSLSICILSLINLIISFISFRYLNIFTFIIHRILISLFNNIVQYIDLPLSLLYTRKEFPFKKRNFSFLQKINGFIYFLLFLFFFKFFKNFYFFCFFLAFLNILCFVFSLIVLGCNKEYIYNRYYPSISEKDHNFLKSPQIKQRIIMKNEQSLNDNNLNIKKTLDTSDNHDIIVNVENNNNNNNMSTNINNTDNLIQSKVNANSVITKNNDNEKSVQNKIKLDEQIITQNESRNNNSQTLRFLFPALFSKQNISPNLYPKHIKIIINLLILFTMSKTLNFISLFMCIFKISKIKIYSFIDKNNNGLLFSEFSLSLKLSTIAQEYLYLFMCCYFLNIFLYLINMVYTTNALKNKIIKYSCYYLSLLTLLISSIFFIYYYLKGADNSKYNFDNIRKEIVLIFVFNFIMNESTMIMSIFYNITGKNNGFGEKILKEIKSISVFFAGIVFLIIQSLTIIINSKTKDLPFENYFYYIIFNGFIIIIFLISLIFF